MEPGVVELQARVHELIARYEGHELCVADLLCDSHSPDQTAFTIVASDLSGKDLSWGQLRQRSQSLAEGFRRQGLGPGDRVATLMGKSADLLVTLLAIWRVGAVQVPLFTAFAPPAITMRLQASQCKLVVCDASQRHKLAEGGAMPEVAPWTIVTIGAPQEGDLRFGDLASNVPTSQPDAKISSTSPIIQIYTSGTTGKPKGVAVPVRALAAFQAYAEFGLDLDRDDVFWNAADPGWAYGLYFCVLATLTTGIRGLVYEGGFSPEATVQILDKYRVTNFAAAPTVYRSILAADLSIPSGIRLKRASSAGEPLTPDVNAWAEAALGTPVRDHYGQTETGMLINNHHHPALQHPLRVGSVGHPMPGWTVAVLAPDRDALANPDSPGRIALDLHASPFAWFGGYVGDVEKTAEKFSSDGRWYFTGDVGRVDADGYFYFSSRDDDVIIMAGYRIGPLEIESIILSHPLVAECAVVARPDQVRGEVLEAAVVLRAGETGSDQLTRELQQAVKVGYAAHAYPRNVHYVDALPKTASGKIQRFEVRKQLANAVTSGDRH